MPEHGHDTQQDKDPWADIRARLEDLGRPQNGGRWAVTKPTNAHR